MGKQQSWCLACSKPCRGTDHSFNVAPNSFYFCQALVPSVRGCLEPALLFGCASVSDTTLPTPQLCRTTSPTVDVSTETCMVLSSLQVPKLRLEPQSSAPLGSLDFRFHCPQTHGQVQPLGADHTFLSRCTHGSRLQRSKLHISSI